MSNTQAAMEFIQTYGWAIMIVLAALAAVSYFGILDPKALLPELCDFPAGMECTGLPAVQGNTIRIAMKNGLGMPVNITNVTTDRASCTVSSFTLAPPNPVPDGGKYTIDILCASALSGKVSETVTVTYMDLDTLLSHPAVGTVRARAG